MNITWLGTASLLPFLFWANRAFQEKGETVAYHIRAEGKEILLFGSLNLDAFPPLSRKVDTRPLKKMMDEKYPQIPVVNPVYGKKVKI